MQNDQAYKLFIEIDQQMSPLKRHFEALSIETAEKEESRILDPKFQPVYESLKGW